MSSSRRQTLRASSHVHVIVTTRAVNLTEFPRRPLNTLGAYAAVEQTYPHLIAANPALNCKQKINTRRRRHHPVRSPYMRMILIPIRAYSYACCKETGPTSGRLLKRAS